ncbi:MAG: paraquat-inducible protein A [Planctomycetota bacterium]|jgi:uncharacterized paraquat-inducible protein A
MTPRRSTALTHRFPYRIEVPALLLASGVLLALGITMPALETRTFFFWREEYSISMNVAELHREGRRPAAFILAACAIVYPATKLLLLGYFWTMPFPRRWRSTAIRLLRLLGRWAMVDVFTISAIIVASSTIGPIHAKPKVGLYLYACGIIALMLVTLLMDRMARRGV